MSTDAPSAHDTLRAGYAAVDITPPAGVDLTGFIARSSPCSGTLDPLEARAVVFEGAGGSRAALVTCDLIGLGGHLVARVRERIAAAAGIPARAALFNCSHTHSGPETGVLTTIGLPDASYLQRLEDALVDVVTRAARSPQPVSVAAASVDVPDGLAINRVYRRIGKPDAYDRQLTVVRLARAGGASDPPLATLVAFACHAVSLGSAETEASADFVATLRNDVEAAGFGPLLYVNGCGGDVNPATMDARGREARDELGHGLARAAVEALSQSREAQRAAATVAAAQEFVALPLQPLRGVAEAAAILAEGREHLRTYEAGSPRYRAALATEVDYALRLLRQRFGSEPAVTQRAEVQTVRVGPLAVVGLPGEIFSSLGRQIKREAPFAAPWTIVAGWTNDNVGYVPDRDAYPLGGYEVDSASRYYGYPAGWAPEAGETLVAAAGRLLRQVANQ
jgi:hypothetical protein